MAARHDQQISWLRRPESFSAQACLSACCQLRHPPAMRIAAIELTHHRLRQACRPHHRLRNRDLLPAARMCPCALWTKMTRVLTHRTAPWAPGQMCRPWAQHWSTPLNLSTSRCQGPRISITIRATVHCLPATLRKVTCDTRKTLPQLAGNAWREVACNACCRCSCSEHARCLCCIWAKPDLSTDIRL